MLQCNYQGEMLKVLIVAATGGLGRVLVKEALARGHTVSVLVRNPEKLAGALPAEDVSRLAVIQGDGSDTAKVRLAAAGQDVVFGCKGGDVDFARVLAEQSKAVGAKLIFVAGATNIDMEDGMPAVQYFETRWAPARAAYTSHQACIDAIRATGVNHIVFCPPGMHSVGAKSSPPPTVRLRFPKDSMFCSYEDAASVMMDAAETSAYDGQHITAVTPKTPVSKEL